MKTGLLCGSTKGLLAAGICACFVSAPAFGAVVFDFGSAKVSGSTTGLTDANANATGTFTTTAGGGSAGISFDLTVSATNGSPNNQTNGLGVTGGTAASGLDNNNAAGPIETMTLTISNFSGLGAGETLVITNVSLLFGANAPNEVYTINGGGDIVFSGTPEAVDVPDAASVTIGAGSTSDTRFAVGDMTVAVVPEPSALALLGFGGLLIARRRR